MGNAAAELQEPGIIFIFQRDHDLAIKWFCVFTDDGRFFIKIKKTH